MMLLLITMTILSTATSIFTKSPQLLTLPPSGIGNWLSRRSPNSPPPRTKTWKTSRKHGWIGSKSSPSRDPSPTAPAPTKDPVQVRLEAAGAVKVQVYSGRNGEFSGEHTVLTGDKFQYEYTDKEKLRIVSRPIKSAGDESPADHPEPQVSHIGTGGKSFTRIKGKGLGGLDHVASGEPRFIVGRGRPGKVEIKPGVMGEREWVKKSSKDSQTTTSGFLVRPKDRSEADGDKEMITIVSNSPSHSPPPSPPRRLAAQSDRQRWHPYLRDGSGPRRS